MNTARQPSATASKSNRLRSAHLSIVTSLKDRSMPTSEELTELVHAVAANGDRQAFAALFKHFAPRVKAYLMRAGSSEGQAEELVQETMISVWRKASMFDARHAAVSTWIFTIARNLRVDHFRRGGSGLLDGEAPEGEERADPALQPDEEATARQRERGVREAMAQLPAEQVQVLRLSFYEEHSHARIAQDLGIPLGTVKSRVRLAVTHLRRMLGEI
ncbi:sigma-70 family RNA polymerase sigma factor [Variovorax sp. J22R133]|uniref:sigma-70 family RNA polymerase sigma factor n=1 Tax=Variovorax brevis TaxID=3053503 RepID=UPI0025778981|nr:sigma-70 family RNA polymerase sigma factor [Variovorax sp. J22R133]MDM0111147.1 sigma-70 family RNA polymerase sigma factor [Variovorax sp. J22R133]